MLSVGETLRRARLEQGLDLGTVAAQTKISAKYLKAIESDDRKSLPSGFFYKSFVEQYAKSLSLDTREIDAEVDRVLSADEPLPLPGLESVAARNVAPISFGHRFPTRRLYASAASLVLMLAGCSGVYAWWHGARSTINLKGMLDNVRAFVQPKAAVANSKIQKLEPKVIAHSAPSSAAQPRPAETPAVPASLASDSKPDDAGEATISAPAAGSDYKAPAALSDYRVMLDLMAHEATWLSLSSDGKPVFSGILQANQTKSVGGKQFAKMRVGNAAGLEVRLNGKLLGPLGARGQVLIVLFTPDNFQIFSPPKESD
jgi:cytoskeletal protein RodZ